MATIDNRLIYEQYANRIVSETPDTPPAPEPPAGPADVGAAPAAGPKDVNEMKPGDKLTVDGQEFTIAPDWAPGPDVADINLVDADNVSRPFKVAELNAKLADTTAVGAPASAGGTGPMDQASQDAWDKAPVRRLAHDVLDAGQTGAKSTLGAKLQGQMFNVARSAIGAPKVDVRGGSVYGQGGQGGAAFDQKAAVSTLRSISKGLCHFSSTEILTTKLKQTKATNQVWSPRKFSYVNKLLNRYL